MKRQWHVRRQVVAHPDGQRRWDQAYQALLRWTWAEMLPPQSTPSNQMMILEVDHACSSVCPGFDPTPSADPDD